MKAIGKLIKADHADEWLTLSAKCFVDIVKSCLSKNDFVNVAISGGSTPLKIFADLAEGNYMQGDDWKRVSFYWVDERTVSADHPDSNYGNACRILKNLPSSFFLMYDHEKGVEDSVSEYNKLLERLPEKNGVPSFDLILLGMGNDGHTASLFPGTKGLDETRRWVIANEVPQLSTTRISLSFPVLHHAKELLILMNGQEKLDILKEVISGVTSYPISKALDGENEKTWIFY